MKFSDFIQQLITAQTEFETYLADNPDLQGITAIEEAHPYTLSYIEGEKFAHLIPTTLASALILPLDQTLQTQATDRNLAWVAVAQPRQLLAQAIALFYQPYRPTPGIHPTAVIDPTVTIGQAVAIGAHCVIQANVTVADGVCLHPNVVVYPGATLGADSVLHANCVIHERTRIGAGCVIHCGAVIGSEGFGFVPTDRGLLKMEQSGYVILEDAVEVGCNATIDRPALGVTRIGQGTKIDNLVQIAHGCQIGQHCAIAAQVGLAGAVKVGNGVLLAGQVGVVDHVTIGEGAIATAKAGIHTTVAPGEIISGIPGIPHKVFLKSAALFRRLPEMSRTLKQLQKPGGKS
jgi:UDP-3-O-[3-hydroxymyristoyl] glucosamine N-acyltransferase